MIFAHVLPNCLSPIIVSGSLLVATAILTESGLAFLGLGDPNVMSWGYMIGASRDFLRHAWWLCAIPGIAIAAHCSPSTGGRRVERYAQSQSPAGPAAWTRSFSTYAT